MSHLDISAPVIIYREDELIFELTRQPSIEILPLVRQRLAGLLRTDIISLVLTADGHVRSFSNKPDQSLLNTVSPESDMGPLQCSSLDILLAGEASEDLRSQVGSGNGLSPQVLYWAVQACLKPFVALSLGLVAPSAGPFLEAVSSIEKLDEQVEANKQAVRRLRMVCNALAGMLRVELEDKVIQSVVQRLKKMPAYGFDSECLSYWEEIGTLGTDFLLYEKVQLDIRRHAQRVLSELPVKERIALLVSEQDYDEWMLEKINTLRSREEFEDIEKLLDAEPLLDCLEYALFAEAREDQEQE